jgi:hypothetical protein
MFTAAHIRQKYLDPLACTRSCARRCSSKLLQTYLHNGYPQFPLSLIAPLSSNISPGMEVHFRTQLRDTRPWRNAEKMCGRTWGSNASYHCCVDDWKWHVCCSKAFVASPRVSTQWLCNIVNWWVNILPYHHATGWTVRGPNPGGCQSFCLLHTGATGPWAHPTSCTMGTRCPSQGAGGVKRPRRGVTTQPHLAPKLSRAITLLPSLCIQWHVMRRPLPLLQWLKRTLINHTALMRIAIEAATTQQSGGGVGLNDTNLVVISTARRPAYIARRCIRGKIINS